MLQLRGITGPYNGLPSKIDFIKSCYRKSLLDPRVRRRAEEWAGKGSRLVQTHNLFEALKSCTSYTSDPVGVEMTKSPSVMLDQMESSYSHMIRGDCDDLACLSYAMLQSIGIPCKLRVIWLPDSSYPRHIYVMAYPSGMEVSFDLTRKDGKLGAEYPFSKKMDF